MSLDGSGGYSLPAGQPVVTGTTISSSTHNTLADDIATAFDTAFYRDGQATATALFNMGGFRIQNMGVATGVAHAVTAAQVQNNSMTLLASVAGTNTITGTATPTPAAYASGQQFILVPAATNTGATTLNVSSLGAKNVFWAGAACVGGELRQSIPALVEYDGTQFNIVGNAFAAPFLDTHEVVMGSADRTKKIRFEVDGLTTATTRVLTVPDADLTIVGTATTQTLTNKTLTSPTIGTSPTAAGATWTDLGAVTTADINGGTIDGAVIGGASAAAGTFTTLTANGNVTLGDAVTDAHTVNGSLTINRTDGSASLIVGGTGRDSFRVFSLAAGSGVNYDVTNAAGSDYEPLGIFAELISFYARTGVLTAAEIARVSSAGIIFPADNTYDIGASGATRPRDFFLGRDATVGGTLGVTGATTLSAALTYGGVTLSNAVTGTGNMVLSASPTLSGTVGGALTFSGALTLSSALTYGGVTLSNAVTGTGNMVLSANPTFTGTVNMGRLVTSSSDPNSMTSSSGVAMGIDSSHASTPNGVLLRFTAASPDNNTQYFLHGSDSTTGRIYIYSDGDLQNHDNSYGAISDERLKNSIRDAGSQWGDVKNLRVRKYKFNSDGENAPEHIGFIAQEVLKVSPGLVSGSEKEHYGVQYSVAYMKLFKAFQEAQARIEALEAKVAHL